MSCRPGFLGKFPTILAAALCVAVSPLHAQITTPIFGAATRDYVFPPVGLGSSETASITVVNMAAPSATTSPTTGAQPSAAPSCTGTISFSNASGAIGTPVSFTVGAGGFQTVTLPFASAGLNGNRGEILGKVSLAASDTAPCSLKFSLETYDSTTFATHAVLTNAAATYAQGSPPILIPLRN
jgi:hypothetical protein